MRFLQSLLVIYCSGVIQYFLSWLLTGTCMWSGGPDAIGSVRPAGKWAQALTCQTAKTPACHIQFVTNWLLFLSIVFFIFPRILSGQSVGKTYSFAIFGCSVGLCELQMCLAVWVRYSSFDSIGTLTPKYISKLSTKLFFKDKGSSNLIC